MGWDIFVQKSSVRFRVHLKVILNWEAHKAVYTKDMISTPEVSLGSQIVETIIKVPKSIS